MITGGGSASFPGPSGHLLQSDGTDSGVATASVVTVSSGTPTSGQVPQFTGSGNAVTPATSLLGYEQTKYDIRTWSHSNGRYVTDAAMASTSATITSNTAAFTAADVGKLVTIITYPTSSGTSVAYAGTVSTVNSGTSITVSGFTNTSGSAISAAFLALGSDETSAFQSALTAMGSSPGLCFVPDGIYLLGGVVGGSGQLTVPAISTTTASAAAPTIGFVGQTPPQRVQWNISYNVPAMSGPIILTLAAGLSGTGSGNILSSAQGTFTNVELVLRNLAFRALPGVFSSGNGISFLNLKWITNCLLEEVSLQVQAPVLALPTPTNYPVGLYMPGLGNGALAVARGVDIVGLGVGMYFGECSNVDDIMCYSCQVGYKTVNMNDAARAGYIFASQCAISLQADAGSGGPQFLDCQLLNIEDTNANWWALSSHISDPNGYLWGRINVHRVIEGTGPSSALTISGAAGLEINVDGQPLVTSVTAAHACTPGETCLANATGGAFTVTTPATRLGTRCTVKKTDSSGNAVTVSPSSGTIDGSASYSLSSQYQKVALQSDGTNWFITNT